MNIIVYGFQIKSTHPILYKILEEFKVKHCHLPGYFFEDIKVPPYTKVTLYHHKLLFYRGPDIAILSRMKPLDAQILKDMRECESIALKMMDRALRSIHHLVPEFKNYEYRTLLYLRTVRYWNHIIEKENIRFVVFVTIPHEVYDYIIYQLCKLKNIPTIILHQTHIKDTILFFDSFENPHVHLKNTYIKLREELKDTPESEIQLKKNIESEFITQTDKLHYPIPFYMKVKISPSILIQFIFEGFHIFKQLLKSANLKELKNEVKVLKEVIKNYLKHLGNKFRYQNYKRVQKKGVKNDKKLFKYYEKLTVEPDFSKDYIYVALHYQPEATTSPFAGIFVYQQLIIQLLSYLVPENVHLYVKEHPVQKAVCRNKEYYEELLSNSNVSLISRYCNTYKLIENSIAVATCTGRVGWEALFKNKPVLVFGAIYYQYIKGAFRINTIEECQHALDQIINQKIKPTLKDIKVFMKALELTCIEGRNFPFFNDYYITEEQNIENVSKAIIERIRLLLNKTK